MAGHHHLPNFLIPKNLREIKHQVSHGLEEKVDETKLTPWVLFIIFVFGPCEVLIPMLFIPAVQQSASGIASVALFLWYRHNSYYDVHCLFGPLRFFIPEI